MAQRRMFSLQIVDTDAFLEMPATSQLLYFHLSMRGDDDGFVANPKRIMRAIGVQEDDLKVLMAKRFILTFDSGIIVIKHWRINNYIQNDRYSETKYLEEKKNLEVKENGSYTERIQPGYNSDTQGSIGKVRLGKDSILAAEPPNEVNILLNFFKETINPHINFANKTERKACEDLLKAYGLSRVKEALTFLEEKRKTDKFLPLITTPFELWTKWAKIKQHLTIKKRKVWKPTSASSPFLPEANTK